MNYRGSYRRLLGNSKSAVVGAIELYNKPAFEYRDEVLVVLLINGWELFLKAVVSRSGGSIYYKKRRHHPYRTLSLTDSFWRATNSPLWPKGIRQEAIGRNLDFLSTFRDNAVHFYNATGFETVVYLLAQTAITNFHDLLKAIFKQDLSEEINWQLLPLGLRAPVDPIVYLAGSRPTGARSNAAVDEFLKSLSDATTELEDAGIDASRLMTVYDVSLNSIKKIESADIVVGVHGDSGGGQVLITRRIDPNRSHPYRQKDVLKKLEENDRAISSHTFQAIAWKLKLRDDPRYCWVEEKTQTKKWSSEVVSLVESLSNQDIAASLIEYNEHQRGLKRRT